jgi:hypothetical protein
LEAELRAFTSDLDAFPALIDFDSAGRNDLRSAITDHGGVGYWAERIGLPLPTGRRRDPYTDTAALTDAEAVIRLLGHLPGERTLRRMGYARLATTVRRAGGSAKFAAAHGLPGPPPLSH